MNDPLMSDDTQAEAPAPTAPPTSQPDQSARFDRLEQVVAELNNAVRATGQQLSAQFNQQKPPAAPEDFLNELATDPRGVIQREARAAFNDAASATLTPTVLQVVDTASKQLLHEQELKIDTQFGIGTWNELFRPQIEADLAQLKAQGNAQATANEPTLNALVGRLYGVNFEKLAEKNRAMEAAMVRGQAHHMIPGGGIPRLRAPNMDDLPNDVEGQIRNWEEKTGQPVDRKQYAKLYYTGYDSGEGRHRTDLHDYLKAVGKTGPEVERMYGSGAPGRRSPRQP